MSVWNPANRESSHAALPSTAKAPPNHAKASAKFAESLDRLKEMFAIAILQRLDAISCHLDADAHDCRDIRDHVFAAFHDIKGQGASFGFPHLSEIGEAVCTAIRREQCPAFELKRALGIVFDIVRRIINNRNLTTDSTTLKDLVATCKDEMRLVFKSP